MVKGKILVAAGPEFPSDWIQTKLSNISENSWVDCSYSFVPIGTVESDAMITSRGCVLDSNME
jgi:hypothetical protein